jgi:hypothetical protein
MFDEKAYMRQYRIKNRVTLLNKKREYYYKHKARLSIVAKKYYLENKDKVLARNRAWRQIHNVAQSNYHKKYYKQHRKFMIKESTKWHKKTFKKYPWLKTFASIKRRVNHSAHYKLYNIKNFLTKDEIKFLWFRDKAVLMKKPSIDRIDGYGDYIFDNCRFIEYQENLSRKRSWRKKEKSLKNLIYNRN